MHAVRGFGTAITSGANSFIKIYYVLSNYIDYQLNVFIKPVLLLLIERLYLIV